VKNSTSFGRGQSQKGWPVTHSSEILVSRCSRSVEKGEADEQVSEIIACDLALSVPYRVGSEIQAPGIEREGGEGGVELHTGVCREVGLQHSGIERATRPCASVGTGATESIHLESDGDPEGSNSDQDIQEVSISEAEAILGQSFLGTGILCGHRRLRQGDDNEVREIPGKP